MKVPYSGYISFDPTTTATLVEAQMGSGKSYAAIRYALNLNTPIIMLTHRIALLGKTQSDFAALGHTVETPYNRNRAFSDARNHRICCVESTIKLAVPSTPFVLLVDEIVDVLHHLIFAKLVTEANKIAILSKISELVMKASHVIFTSADADTQFADCLFKEFPRADWQYIQYVNPTAPNYRAVILPVGDKRSLMTANLVSRFNTPGSSLWVNVNCKAASSRKSPMALAQFAGVTNYVSLNATSLKDATDKAFKLDTKINETSAFDAVFVSSAINSGVSVTSGTWSAVITDLLSNVSVRQALQSAMRVRDLMPVRYFVVRQPKSALAQQTHAKIEDYLKANNIPFKQKETLLLPHLTSYFVSLETLENADPFAALCRGLETKNVEFEIGDPYEILLSGHADPNSDQAKFVATATADKAPKDKLKALRAATEISMGVLNCEILDFAVTKAMGEKSYTWDNVSGELPESEDGLATVVEQSRQATSATSLFLKEIADFLGMSDKVVRMNAHKFKSATTKKKVSILAAILNGEKDFINAHILTSRRLKEYETQGIPFAFNRVQQYQIALQQAAMTEEDIFTPSPEFVTRLIQVVTSTVALRDIRADYEKSDLSETRKIAALLKKAMESLGLHSFRVYTEDGEGYVRHAESVSLAKLIVGKALERKLEDVKLTVSSGMTISRSLQFADAVKDMHYAEFISSDFSRVLKASYVRTDRKNAPAGRYSIPVYPPARCLSQAEMKDLLMTNRDSLLFVDTETYHPSAHQPSKGKRKVKLGTQALCRRHNRIRLLQVATLTDLYYVDFGVDSHIDDEMVELLAKCTHTVWHNAIFDCSSLGQKHSHPGMVSLIKPHFDTLLGLKAIYGTYTGTEIFKAGFGLKPMASYLTGIAFPHEGSSDWGTLFLTDEQISYAVNDLVLTRLLYDFCNQALSAPFIVGNPGTPESCWAKFRIDVSGLTPAIMGELKGIQFNESPTIKIKTKSGYSEVPGFRDAIKTANLALASAEGEFKSNYGASFRSIKSWVAPYDVETDFLHSTKPKDCVKKLVDSGVNIPPAAEYKALSDMAQYVMQLNTALLAMDKNGNIPIESSYCTGAGRSAYSSGCKTDGFKTVGYNSLPRATRIDNVPLPRYMCAPPSGFKMADSDIGGSHLKIAIQLSASDKSREDIAAGYDMHSCVGFTLFDIIKDLPQIAQFLPEMEEWLQIKRPITAEESQKFAKLATRKASIFDVCRQVGKLVYSSLNGGNPAVGSETIFVKNIPGDYSAVRGTLASAFSCYGNLLPYVNGAIAYTADPANIGYVGDFKGTFFDSGNPIVGTVYTRVSPTNAPRRVMSKLLQGTEALIMRDSMAQFFAEHGSDDCYLSIVNHDSQAWVIKDEKFMELALLTQVQMWHSSVAIIGEIDMGVITEMPSPESLEAETKKAFPSTDHWA